jgi:hypothetical protein
MEVKHTSDKGSTEKRIADRLKPSNVHGGADHHSVSGTGARRTSVTIHSGGGQTTRGSKDAAHGHEPMDPLDPQDGGQ